MRLPYDWAEICDRCERDMSTLRASEVFLSGGRSDMRQIELCGACARELGGQLKRWLDDKRVVLGGPA